MDIHDLLSQGNDQQAIVELRKQNIHAYEVRFCLGDWSLKTLRKRYTFTDKNAQQRIRCDKAFLYCTGQLVHQPKLKYSNEERKWTHAISSYHVPKELLPHPSLAWQSPFRTQQTVTISRPYLVRQCLILDALSVDPRPWLQHTWNQRSAEDLSTLIEFALLGIYTPFALHFSRNALHALKTLQEEPLWQLLLRLYDTQKVSDIRSLAIHKYQHSPFLLRICKEILLEKAPTTIVRSFFDSFPQLIREQPIFRPYLSEPTAAAKYADHRNHPHSLDTPPLIRTAAKEQFASTNM